MIRTLGGFSLLEVVFSLVLISATSLALLKRQQQLMQSVVFYEQQWSERLALDNRLERRS